MAMAKTTAHVQSGPAPKRTNTIPVATVAIVDGTNGRRMRRRCFKSHSPTSMMLGIRVFPFFYFGLAHHVDHHTSPITTSYKSSSIFSHYSVDMGQHTILSH